MASHSSLPMALPDALLRVAETLEAGVAAGLAPIQELCVETDPDIGPKVNIESLDAYEWANYLNAKAVPNVNTGEVTFNHESAGINWIIRYVPERRGGHIPTNWAASIQQTTALPMILRKVPA